MKFLKGFFFGTIYKGTPIGEGKIHHSIVPASFEANFQWDKHLFPNQTVINDTTHSLTSNIKRHESNPQ